MPFGGSVAIRAMKDGDFVATMFPGTTTGLQAAIDYLGGAAGEVATGPGILQTDSPISVHSGLRWAAHGTTIKRAAGSFTGTSPAYFANMVISTAFGANGTLSDSGTPQSDISIEGLTIDGNSAAFSGVTFTSPGLITGHYGIKFQYVDGIVLRNIVCKNLLQTGTDLVSCANARCSNLQYINCGQYATAASRNSFNFNNGDAGAIAAGYAQGLVLDNMVSEGATDTNVTLKNVMDVTISNCVWDGAKIGIEVESTSSAIPLLSRYSISNIAAKNQTMNFIRFSPSTGTGYENITVSNCICDLHPTNHANDIATAHSAAIFLGRTNDAYFKHLTITDVTVRNINSFSANSEASMLLFNLPGTTQSEHIRLRNITLIGANGAEFNSANNGFEIAGHVAHLTIEGCHVQNAENNGFLVGPNSAGKECRDVRIRGCSVDGAQADGFKILTAVNASISRVDVADCQTKDCAIGTSSRGFIVGVSATAGNCTDVSIKGCRVTQTSGAISGFEVFQNTAGVVDNFILENNDTSDIGVGGTPYRITGAPTNIHIVYAVRQSPNITAASTITLLPGNFSVISGNTNIDNITNSVVHKGREIVLQCTGTPTFNHNSGGTGNLRCDGAANKVMTGNDIIRFVSDGSLWWQCGPVMVL